MQMTYSDLLKRKYRLLKGGEADPVTPGTTYSFKGNAKRQAIIVFQIGDSLINISGKQINNATGSLAYQSPLVIDIYTFGDIVREAFTVFLDDSRDTVVELYIDDEVYKG